mgnify:CR=1 FL=1
MPTGVPGQSRRKRGVRKDADYIAVVICRRQKLREARPEAHQRERGVKARMRPWPLKMAIIPLKKFVSG